MDSEAPIYNKSAFEFKSTSFSVPVLVLSSTELEQIERQLEEKISQAPAFFKNSPLLINLQSIDQQQLPLNFTALIELLHAHELIPIGLSGGNDEQNNLALKARIAVHSLRGLNSSHTLPVEHSAPIQEEHVIQSPPEIITEPEPVLPVVENKLISQPIRSGQRIYAKGDLIVLSHVSAGAEIMAEGNIHVYGSLRGRALAGVLGDLNSRIFCSDLQAELISIAGNYKVNEELDQVEHNKPVQIFLQEQALIIKNIGMGIL